MLISDLNSCGQSWQAGKVMQEAVLQKNPSEFLDGWGETEVRRPVRVHAIELSLRCSMEVD